MIGFKDPDYCPGGRSDVAERRARARRAGYASGVARRRRSTVRRPPRARTGQHAVSLAYKVRQVTAAEFEDRYRVMCEQHDGAGRACKVSACDLCGAKKGTPCAPIPFDQRGLNTARELYRQQMTAFRHHGQDWETTNAQISRGLECRGRGRSRRTVQRNRKRLEAMGLVGYSHVVRSGWLRIPGKLDTLRVRCMCPARIANGTPPPGAGAWLRQAAPACTSKSKATALSPPTSSADEDPPASPEHGATTERTETEQRLFWLELKAEHAPNMMRPSEWPELERRRAQAMAQPAPLRSPERERDDRDT